ncbi:HAMP domain-containing protein [Staphylococcus massiliensis]|uniref:ATP-binding protein n=1 Tax=Staphylococcus massiliensis TaxID=555791 RepID=UPI001EE06803|nr:HAMP domain-containing protein [Staphylococcus massiliensis]
MMKRLNSVVVKLWLTIMLIVTTVLILLSAALITFISYYYTKETEQSLFVDAKRVSELMESSDDKEAVIKQSHALIEGPEGLIIFPYKDTSRSDDKTELKRRMLNEIEANDAYKRVIDHDETHIQHVSINYKGKERTYVLVGYPSQDAQNKKSAVFIYQDLKSIEDTTNVITIIILITALLSLFLTTIFAFFLSTRITKPLRQMRSQVNKLAKGEYHEKIHVNTKDEIGELALTFNKMSSEIRSHISTITSAKHVRDTLIESMIEGVLGINAKKDIILSNKLAHSILLQMTEDDERRFNAQIDDTFESEEVTFKEYEMFQRYYVVIMSFIENIDHSNECGIVVIIRDMTNEHNLDQLKKDFIANVSHELRTPISLLQGYTEAIVDGIVSEPNEIRDSLSVVLDESKRLNRLVNELLNVAKMDAEGLSMDITKQPIDVLADKIDMKYQQQIDQLGLKMNIDIEANMDDWYYDIDRMDQVVTNLLDNATRYTEPGDTITITAFEDSSNYVLSIADTGAGISPEHLPLVFDRFYKVDASRKRGKQGTGLGLFICRMIIEEHGGQITADSKYGQGTTFKIILPKQPKSIQNNQS